MNKPLPKASLAHVTDWVFDLDNTLYSRHHELFSQIDWKMSGFVSRLTGLPLEEARLLQKRLYRQHGTTLAGLMAEYDIDPQAFLADVHDIDYSAIPANPELGRAIAMLPGRKHIFTNADVPHAERTLEVLGFGPVFDAKFDIVAAGFAPKPARIAYERFIQSHGVEPTLAAMFEDMPRNLEVPKALGMVTVLIAPGGSQAPGVESWEFDGHDASHVDHVTDDLNAFLQELGDDAKA